MSDAGGGGDSYSEKQQREREDVQEHKSVDSNINDEMLRSRVKIKSNQYDTINTNQYKKSGHESSKLCFIAIKSRLRTQAFEMTTAGILWMFSAFALNSAKEVWFCVSVKLVHVKYLFTACLFDTEIG